MTNLNITSGVWCCASSDTHDGWTAVWADSGYRGVKQVALIPTEFSEAVSNAKLMAEARSKRSYAQMKAVIDKIENSEE